MSNDTQSNQAEPPAPAGGGSAAARASTPELSGAPSPENDADPLHAALAEVRAELAETRRILDSLKRERTPAGAVAPSIPSGAMSPRIAVSGASRLAAAARVASQSGDRASLMSYLRLRRAAG